MDCSAMRIYIPLLLMANGLLTIAAGRIRMADPVTKYRTLSHGFGFVDLSSNGYKWSEEWLEGVPVDHFSFTNKDSFALRFFINTDSYVNEGPILFYTGNEGGLESFAENTGFMWDLAPQLSAAVVFAEHRFYGKTQPFKNESYTSTDRLGYLSSEQALADFVLLIDYLKTQRIRSAVNSPVIAFGGSYGGMLSAWLRIKYPHKVEGAIAASAPVFWFIESKIPEDIYDRIVTRSFVASGCNFKAIEKGWTAIQSLAQTANGRSYLNKLFKLEKKSELENAADYKFLVAYVKEVFESMAMVNYPYPSNFLSPLPGWPVKESCKFFTNVSKTDEAAADQLYQITNLYYNYTGKVNSLCANSKVCEGGYAALGDPLGWPWQTCTEMTMPLCSSGPPNDFFPRDCPFTVEAYLDSCNECGSFMFGKIGFDRSMLRPQWATQLYGTKFPTASNIVFSNGYLDPWSGGGWSMKTVTQGTIQSIIIKEGAHHYDLRGAHPDDTEEIRKVRAVEKSAIQSWIKMAKKNTKTYQF